jgi:outer membrane protein OmpA-like peptidoglycan-associated protein
MADGLTARASASFSARCRVVRGCLVCLVLSCAPKPLPEVGAPVGRSDEPRGGGNVAPERSARAVAVVPAAPASNGAPPPTNRAGARDSHEPSRRLCDLPDTASEALLFASNDANLRKRGTQILDDVIACMKAGLLGRHRLLVVGYADPRGEPSQNEAIALERARAAQRYLIRRGVPAERIEIASRGERQALGEAPESWFYDRRVEIRLLPEPDR